MWKGNWNTTTLLISLQGLEFLQRAKRTMDTIVIEYFNSLVFHMSGPVKKQYTYQSNKRYLNPWFPDKCVKISNENRK
jgi:hypothetical protein